MEEEKVEEEKGEEGKGEEGKGGRLGRHWVMAPFGSRAGGVGWRDRARRGPGGCATVWGVIEGIEELGRRWSRRGWSGEVTLPTQPSTLDAIAFRKYKKEISGKINKLSILRNEVLPKPVHVHAEVQLAMLLITYKSDSDYTLVENCKYIGCSKKSCYLCSQFLHGLYRTRGSHGKVYHQWTLPAVQGLGSLAALKLHARIAAIGNHMRGTLLGPKSAKRPMVSESTVTATTTSQVVKGKWMRALRPQRTLDMQPQPENNLPAIKLGRLERVIEVLRFPAHGSPIIKVDIPLRKRLIAYTSFDSFDEYVLDFSACWPGELNYDRGKVRFEVNTQADASLDGSYVVFYNTSMSEELPVNKAILELIHLVEIPPGRMFWYGDAFLVNIGKRTMDKPNLVPPDANGPSTLSQSESMEVDFNDHGNLLYENVGYCRHQRGQLLLI